MKKEIFISDFDNTIANTKEKVEDACGETIIKLYGFGLYNCYRKEIGGLKNRAPDELLSKLFPDRDKKEVGEMTALFAETKLNFLYNEISSDWPEINEGFVDFYDYLNRKNINFAIVSSGHTSFIRKFFEVNSLEVPKIIISNDELVSRNYLSVLRRNKPSVFPIMLAHRQHLGSLGLLGVNFDMEKIREAKKYMVYLGDDTEKDGLMANNAKILFGHYREGENFEGIENKRFSFDDFRVIIKLIEENILFKK